MKLPNVSSSLVIFCGKEFSSGSKNVSEILRSKNISSLIVDQSKVAQVLTERNSLPNHTIVAVPLMSKLDSVLLRKSVPNLKLIQQWGVGIEGVDVSEATKLGILVANTPSAPLTAVSTAEQAIRLLLDAARYTFGHPNAESKPEHWGSPRGNNLYLKRIGVVGFTGAVGSRISSILRNGFGAEVVGIGRSDVPLSEALRNQAKLDGLVLVTPVTSHTRGMVNDSVFAYLNPGAYVINVGRGPLVDRPSLIRALENDPKLKYATDVWWTEPPDYSTDQLVKHPRVILSPHIGGMTHESSVITDERCAQGIIEFLIDGKIPTFCVNASKEKNPQHQPHQTKPLHSQFHPPTLTRPSSSVTARVVEELRKIIRTEKLTTNPTELLKRGTDESLHDPVPPDICVMPSSTAEVSQILRICSKYAYPVVPFGRGTSLEGGVSALAGGLSIDMSNMNRVLAVNTKDFDCLVEAGVTRMQLNQELRNTGLFFPVDPGADATLGGMCATRASGTTAVKYGTMRDRVMGLTVVLPNGEIIKTGGRALKSSAGYDLTALLVGSEGTLGVITEARLKLAPTPEAFCSAVAQFRNTEDAVNTVIELKQMGIPLARAEFLDKITMEAVRKAGLSSSVVNDVDYPSLFLEFHGSPATVLEQSAFAKSVANGLVSYHQSVQEEERNKLWRARHNAFYAVMKLRPAGTKGLPTDVCVPVSRLAECITETADDVKKESIIAPIFGHIGDGNFHCILLHNHQIDGEAGLTKLQKFNERLVLRALKMEGTCTGEHGIGYGKKSWLEVEHGLLAVKMMKDVKRSIDPQNIMNPGKLF
jgi:D-lactate dehydrogenase (cytochrome)